MKLSALALLAVLLCSTSFAESVSLVCEHDGGVNRETGLRDGLYADVFGFSVDLVQKRITAGFNYADGILLVVSSLSIEIKVEYEDEGYSDIWWYKVNRYTGTLFAKRVSSGGAYHAKGQCVLKDSRWF